jgi:hypothetical protein
LSHYSFSPRILILLFSSLRCADETLTPVQPVADLLELRQDRRRYVAAAAAALSPASGNVLALEQVEPDVQRLVHVTHAIRWTQGLRSSDRFLFQPTSRRSRAGQTVCVWFQFDLPLSQVKIYLSLQLLRAHCRLPPPSAAHAAKPAHALPPPRFTARGSSAPPQQPTPRNPRTPSPRRDSPPADPALSPSVTAFGMLLVHLGRVCRARRPRSPSSSSPSSKVRTWWL